MSNVAAWMDNYVRTREQKQTEAYEKARQSTIKDGSDFTYAQDAIRKRNDILGAPLWVLENWKLLLLGVLALVVILKD